MTGDKQPISTHWATPPPDYHVSALLEESIDGLNIRGDGVYVDATFGGGGHSREILKRLTTGRLIALDQDADALANRPDDRRLIMEQGNFRFLRNYLAHYGIRNVDGILADLGVSSHHFDTVERGFTFRHDAPLDMRMNTGMSITAAEVINRYPENSLREIFGQYGEVSNAQRLAGRIVTARRSHPIERSGQLLETIKPCMPRGSENKYAAKVFQALRIAVNRELDHLKSLLLQSLDLLPAKGRLAIITYHSLEDRLVKNFLKNGLFEGEAEKDIYGQSKTPFRQINTKIITPSEHEIKANSRVRSAKLRIGERVK
ncbi:MAG: 16S rRNA (cytosine(1402)-N(4))-methyltransferase RsmH [Bacteroidales bacterium]|jgi:16S rRNA (cytosine1402-N4)-methyltransferase|nr:16S rRNA (cytosine(1402)-N(4))-methyltransferase RsmH [Bacteroidales bacterium]